MFPIMFEGWTPASGPRSFTLLVFPSDFDFLCGEFASYHVSASGSVARSITRCIERMHKDAEAIERTHGAATCRAVLSVVLARAPARAPRCLSALFCLSARGKDKQ